MIVHNLYVIGVTRPPAETDPPLLVDTNAVLPFSVATQGLKTVAWWNAQFIQIGCRVYSSLVRVKPSAALL